MGYLAHRILKFNLDLHGDGFSGRRYPFTYDQGSYITMHDVITMILLGITESEKSKSDDTWF